MNAYQAMEKMILAVRLMLSMHGVKYEDIISIEYNCGSIEIKTEAKTYCLSLMETEE